MKARTVRVHGKSVWWQREGDARPEEQRVLWGSDRDRLGWGRVSGEGRVTRAVCGRRISGTYRRKVCEGKGGMHSAWFGTSEFGVSVEHPRGDG